MCYEVFRISTEVDWPEDKQVKVKLFIKNEDNEYEEVFKEDINPNYEGDLNEHLEDIKHKLMTKAMDKFQEKRKELDTQNIYKLGA